MYMIAEVSQYVAVASFAEAWIEICTPAMTRKQKTSPPSRRRGLKSCIQGIWINTDVVASFAEAWIEIGKARDFNDVVESPPSRRRGLKFSLLL